MNDDSFSLCLIKRRCFSRSVIKAISRAFLLCLFLVSSTAVAFAQNNAVIDSLKLVLRNTSNDSTKLVLMYKIGWQYAWAGQYQSQHHYAEAIIKLAEKINNIPYLARGYYDLGIYFNSVDNYDQAMFNTNRALQLFAECHDTLGMASVYQRLGLYQAANHKSNAIENYKTASRLFLAIGQPSDAATVEDAIGSLYFDINNFSESVKHVALSLKYFENDKEQEGYINPLNLYRMQGYYDEILQLYLRKLNEFEKSGYVTTMRIGRIKIVIGNVYNEKGDYEKAIRYLTEGIASFRNKVPVVVLPVYEGLAKAYLMKVRDPAAARMYNYTFTDSAVRNATKALQLATGLHDKESMEECTVLLASAFLERAKYSGKKGDLLNALHLFGKIKLPAGTYRNKMLMRDAYAGMAEVYSSLGDYKRAFQLSKYSSRLKDSITNDDNAIKMERLRLQVEVDKTVETERAESQKLLYEEQMRHRNAMAEQKRSEDRLLSLKEAKTNRILAAGGLLLVTGFFSVLFFRQRSAKNRALEKAETLHRMTELELQSLRAQLNPHFMFNSLNAIQELILLEDNERSHIYLSAFADLLRMLLDNADQPFISLESEIAFLKLYLSLENLRIPDLNYSIEIDPAIDAERTMIPNMLFQPYIENAIWHGLAHKKGDRRLQITVDERDNAMIFQIMDNGIGRKKASELKSIYRKKHRSKGMELLSKRFSLLSKEYAAKIETSITDVYANGEAAGTLVQIVVPSFLSEKFEASFYGAHNHN
ncbi:MAG TPA: histidine kinase [Parafilimonas sp.]|nr:histidine kinase [Parafilimonas sp.]